MELHLTKPKKLQQGDTIGVIAPSAGNANFFPHRVENAIKFLKSEGYKVILSANATKNRDYVSAEPIDRANDINEMFADRNVKAIICTIGGNHSNQLIKYIDFEIIKNNPKIFLGYSDISVLHYAFLKKGNLQTYYGPCLMTQFGEYPNPLEYTYEYFKKALVDEGPIGDIRASNEWTSEILNWVTKSDLERPRKLEKSSGYEWLKFGHTEANIIGGCVPSINHTIGTDFWIDPTDKVFFIDVPEGYNFGEGLPVADLDSYMADLDNIGVFSSIKGLIFGRPYNYNNDQLLTLKKIIHYYTDKYDYPILLNANIGHTDPIITLPMMAEVILDSENNRFEIRN